VATSGAREFSADPDAPAGRVSMTLPSGLDGLALPGSIFHVGILAENLEAAIARHTNALGIEFLAPVERRLARFVDDVAGTAGPVTLRYTYSVGGPPRFELLEARPTGFYVGDGLHHVGAWSADVVAATRALARHSVRREAAIETADGELVAAYFRPEDLGGTRLELVSERSVEFIDTWVRTGAHWRPAVNGARTGSESPAPHRPL